MKKFTLIELIVVIVTFGIILSVILLNFFDVKKKTITNTMAQNISIMQGMVDSYYTTENQYPIVNQHLLRLDNPQLIDIDTLLESNIQKKDLDLSKISEQYYWVDVFGKVWGATTNSVETISLIDKGSNKYSLEALIDEGFLGLNIYKVSGYGSASSNYFNNSASLNDLHKSYKVIEEYELDYSNKTVVNYEFTDSESQYLFSFIDEYGLETAPMGKSFNPYAFKPLIDYEGEYEFEIEGEETMFWIDFISLEEIKGKSTIEYFFTVKDSNGNYKEEWTEDFFSLNPSKGIKVKVVMKADLDGNKPSLLDLHILFKYEEIHSVNVETEEPVITQETELCPNFSQSSSFNKYSNSLTNGDKGKMIYKFKVSELETLENSYVPNVNFASNIKYKVLNKEFYIANNGSDYVLYNNQETSGKCMVVVYEIEITSFKEPFVDKKDLCGSGSVKSSYSKSSASIVNNFYLEKGQSLSKINKPSISLDWVMKSMYIQVSEKGSEFKRISSISELKEESCVQVVFNYTIINGYPTSPPISVIEVCHSQECEIKECSTDCMISVCKENCSSNNTCEVNCSQEVKEDWCDLNPTNTSCISYCIQEGSECVKPVCLENCSTYPPDKPNPNDKELQNPEWTTVDRLQFFGHGAVGQLTRWYRAEHTDSINSSPNSDETSLSLDGETRIIYRYAKSTGSYWSNEYEDFSTTEHAQRVLAIAYIQVKTSKINEVPQDKYPNVTTMKFYNEKGVLDISMVQPTVAIIANKDNNLNREVFSDESNISWDYVAADPRNKNITNVEWSGDKRDKYPVGTYEVKIRVQNEVGYWSEWTSFQLEVLQEKPTAVISVSSTGSIAYPSMKDSFKWSMAKSFDSDGDKILKYEWKNNKSLFSQLGDNIVELRVQDSEGYWSDWVSYKITMHDLGEVVYRLEAEATNSPYVIIHENAPSWSNVSRPENIKNSNGKSLYLNQNYPNDAGQYYTQVEFKIEGNGFAIAIENANDLKIYLDNVLIDTVSTNEPILFERQGLETKSHSLVLRQIFKREYGTIDYVDVYSNDDKPRIENVYGRVLDKNNTENTYNNQLIVNSLDQKLKVYYTLFKNSIVDIDILKDGKTIKTVKKGNKEEGGFIRTHYAIWDGTNSSSEKVSTGDYQMRIKAKGVHDGLTTESLFTISVDNQKVIYRIEGEDTDTEKVELYEWAPSWGDLGPISDNSYSGGQGLYMGTRYNSYYTTATFKFTGTGFDLKQIDPKGVSIYLDGVLLTTLTYGGEHIYSMRDLTYGDHSVLVRQNNIGQTTTIDYVDIYSSNDQPLFQSVYGRNVDNDNKEYTYNSNVLNLGYDQSLKVYYKMFKNGYMSVDVYDQENKLVRKLQKDKFVTGGSVNLHSITWDGKNDFGVKVNDGKYNFKFKVIGVDKVLTAEYSYISEVSNANKEKRIEAETTNTSEVVRYEWAPSWGHLQVVSNESFSGGQGIYIGTGYTNYHTTLTFNFEGTGFDLSLLDTVGARIYIDGQQYLYLSDSGKHIMSIRNLEDTTHTVVIRQNTKAEKATIDYLDVYK